MNTKQVLFLYGNEQETKHEMAEHSKDHSENLWKKKVYVFKAAYCSGLV